MKPLRLRSFVLFALWLLSSCSVRRPRPRRPWTSPTCGDKQHGSGRLRRQRGWREVQVRALAPAGTDPHTFQPTPASIRILSQARVVFFNGAGLEEWWDRTIRSVKKPEVPVIELSQGPRNHWNVWSESRARQPGGRSGSARVVGPDPW